MTPKSVRIDRINTRYVCRECHGFLMVFGNKKDDMYRCTLCNRVVMGERLDGECMIKIVEKEE